MTPMLEQYVEWKDAYPDCLLFFRMGDFYEMFFDDAEIASSVLDIALTSRSKENEYKIPMAGVPYHSVDSYLGRLIAAGYRVAICEQITEPDGKGLLEKGTAAPDITLLTAERPDGIRLSELRGGYVLIELRAARCAPGRSLTRAGPP